jgi:hypothetical protein
VSVDCERFQTPFAFILLYDPLTFLAFRKTEVVLWDLNGQLLSRFEDHKLWFPAAAEDHTSVIYISMNQDLVRPQGRLGGGLTGDHTSPHLHIGTILRPTAECNRPGGALLAGESGGR